MLSERVLHYYGGRKEQFRSPISREHIVRMMVQHRGEDSRKGVAYLMVVKFLFLVKLVLAEFLKTLLFCKRNQFHMFRCA
jgi:hypothetical protein